MVKSVNGDRGSSVIPIEGDDYLFLSRGRHVLLDDGDVHMSGLSGNTLSQGIAASQDSKVNQMQRTANTIKATFLIPLPYNGDFLMTCDSSYVIN